MRRNSSFIIPHSSLPKRETGFEPATSTLARSHSTTELLPRERLEILRIRGRLSSRPPERVRGRRPPSWNLTGAAALLDTLRTEALIRDWSPFRRLCRRV